MLDLKRREFIALVGAGGLLVAVKVKRARAADDDACGRLPQQRDGRGLRAIRGRIGGRKAKMSATMVGDPVGAGFVESLARPGGTSPDLSYSSSASARNGSNCSRRSRPG